MVVSGIKYSDLAGVGINRASTPSVDSMLKESGPIFLFVRNIYNVKTSTI